jgi:transcriptional regulator with XRE-family HTH domain
MTELPTLVRSPEALKAARHALGLSADGLARMLRVDDGRSIRRWEAGESAIPGPVTVVMETAMNYLAKRAMIARLLEMLRSGNDADYAAVLNILRSVDDGLETLTRQPPANEAAREAHWYHLRRQPPKYTPPEKDDWSVPGELSPEAALIYFENHEGFNGGLLLCDDFDLAAEFILEKRELLRTPRGNSLGLRAGKSLKKFHVKRRS